MRTVITSPERLFLDCLASLFSGNRFHVVSVGTDVREAIVAAQRENADLLVFDLRGASAGDVQFLLGAQSFGDFRTMLITDSGIEIPDGLATGVSRSESGQAMLAWAEALCADIVAFAPPSRGAQRRADNGLALSHREYELAQLIAKGYTNQKIAETMAIKEQTIKNLVSTVIRKLRCENRVQVALMLSPLRQPRLA